MACHPIVAKQIHLRTDLAEWIHKLRNLLAPYCRQLGNGNILKDGDDVVMAKDLAVKGAPKALKAGTKVRNIKLVEGDHNIDCRIEGFGAMALKSEFVKKA